MDETIMNIILWVSGIIIGAVVGYFLNLHFFRKAKKKTELTTRLHHSTSTILVNKEIEEHLEIKFKGKEVSYLHQFQFVILNSGDFPIKSPIKPLSLIVPEYYDYISVEIKHIHPEGREITFKLSHSDKEIQFLFDLLNPKEYFIVNLMLSVNVENKNKATLENPEFKFLITSENLPPQLNTDLITLSNYIESSILYLLKPLGKIFLDVLVYILGFIGIGGIFMLVLLLKISVDNPKYNILNLNYFFSSFDLWSLFMLVTWVLEIPLLLFCVFIFLEIFRKKDKVKKGFLGKLEELPENILKNW